MITDTLDPDWPVRAEMIMAYEQQIVDLQRDIRESFGGARESLERRLKRVFRLRDVLIRMR